MTNSRLARIRARGPQTTRDFTFTHPEERGLAEVIRRPVPYFNATLTFGRTGSAFPEGGGKKTGRYIEWGTGDRRGAAREGCGPTRWGCFEFNTRRSSAGLAAGTPAVDAADAAVHAQVSSQSTAPVNGQGRRDTPRPLPAFYKNRLLSAERRGRATPEGNFGFPAGKISIPRELAPRAPLAAHAAFRPPSTHEKTSASEGGGSLRRGHRRLLIREGPERAALSAHPSGERP